MPEEKPSSNTAIVAIVLFFIIIILVIFFIGIGPVGPITKTKEVQKESVQERIIPNGDTSSETDINIDTPDTQNNNE